MGTQPPPQKGGTAAPNFWPMYCGQMAGWIKMPLGTEVGFGPDDIVLDGAKLAQKRGTAANFRPMSIVAKRSPISASAELLYSILSRNGDFIAAYLIRTFNVVTYRLMRHRASPVVAPHGASEARLFMARRNCILM